MSHEEFIRATLNSYHRGNCHYHNKQFNSDCNKFLLLRRKTFRLIVCHDAHSNNVKNNNEHPNDINNIDTENNSEVRKNDTLRNYVNDSNTNSNKSKNSGSDNDDINNIDTENNIYNAKVCYNCKRRQSSRLIKTYGKSLPYTIQFIQKSNTNIF